MIIFKKISNICQVFDIERKETIEHLYDGQEICPTQPYLYKSLASLADQKYFLDNKTAIDRRWEIDENKYSYPFPHILTLFTEECKNFITEKHLKLQPGEFLNVNSDWYAINIDWKFYDTEKVFLKLIKHLIEEKQYSISAQTEAIVNCRTKQVDSIFLSQRYEHNLIYKYLNNL